MQGSTAKIALRWTALGALFLIPITPLIVVNTFFFPFITGKAFYFRILVEIAFAAWVALAAIDKHYRPRVSWITISALAFVAWMFVADLFALNVEKAFWSNFERMEGWVLLIHLLGFFLVMSAVLRVEKKWRAWFLTTVGVSAFTACYALLQLAGALAIHQGSTRIDTTLGNSAYFAIYLLFNVFIALWLALTERQSWLKWSLLGLAALEVVLIFFTETRGTILGLIGASLLAALLTAVTATKKVRQYALYGIAAILILVGAAWAAKNTPLVKNNHVLERITSISLSDGATRFKIWNMAWQGFQDRPITGWGQEGFNYVFNQYYDPALYGQEPWFDRAHNAFIDWLIAGGAPGLLLFLALFGSALVLLWRTPDLTRAERTLFTAALAGYACHNFFVFDNLYSYVHFFAILALIDSQVGKPVKSIEHFQEASKGLGPIYAIPFSFALALVLIWTVNIPGMRASSELIVAISPSPEGPSGNIKAFEVLLAHPAFASQEIREQLVSFALSIVQSHSVSNEDKVKAVQLAITQMAEQVKKYPQDARERLQLVYAFQGANARDAAYEEIKKALALSPKKIQMLLEAGGLAWDTNHLQEAHDYFAQAYTLAPHARHDLAVYAAAGEMAVNNMKGADAILMQEYGTTAVNSDVLGIAYYRLKNWPRLIALWKMRAEAPGAGAKAQFSLAAAYYESGDRTTAIAILERVKKEYPESADDAQKAIEQVRQDVKLPN